MLKHLLKFILSFLLTAIWVITVFYFLFRISINLFNDISGQLICLIFLCQIALFVLVLAFIIRKWKSKSITLGAILGFILCLMCVIIIFIVVGRYAVNEQRNHDWYFTYGPGRPYKPPGIPDPMKRPLEWP